MIILHEVTKITQKRHLILYTYKICEGATLGATKPVIYLRAV